MINNRQIVDFAAVLQAAPDLYMLLSPELNIIGVNDAYARATMTRNDEVAGRHLFEVFPDNPDDTNATGVGNLSTSLSRVLATKQPDAMAVQKYDVRGPDGTFEERHWSCVNTPVLGADGEIIAILHRAEDVTDFLGLKRELDSRTEQVEREIVRRARDVQDANKRLEQANTTIARADAQKSFFLAAASHDLRQPLQAVTSYLGALAPRLEDAERDLCGRAQEAVAIANDILRSLLDISQLERGDIDARIAPVSVSHLFARVISQSEHEARTKGLTLTAPKTDIAVQGDIDLLERVIANFVANALHHTDTGGIEMLCEVRGGVARLAVKDSGRGIAPEQQQRIFDEFVQLDNPERNRRRGYGLGLAIAKRVAEALGAAIGVDSVVGQGSTFWIEAPVADAAVIVPSVPALTMEPAEPSQGLAGCVLLMIEDDDLVADATMFVLELEGVTARRASTVKEAREVIESGFAPELVLSDYRLPDGDGFAAIAAVKQTLGRALPSILMTGDVGFARRSENDQLILTKPVGADELVAALTKMRGAAAP